MQPACKLLGTQTYILESMRTSELFETGASLLSCTRNARRSQDREKRHRINNAKNSPSVRSAKCDGWLLTGPYGSPELADRPCPGVPQGACESCDSMVLHQRLGWQWRSALKYHGLPCRGLGGGRSCCRGHCCTHWST